jgi:DNA-binding transcriptional regulator YhcF (GntR family)
LKADVPIHIDKNADTPVYHQLREQIIFLISTGELAIGSFMPSGHELDRRLGIHRNTVYHVYSELEREGWLVKRRGSQFAVVRSAEGAKDAGASGDLDDLIDRTIHLAQQRGYTLQQLAQRVRRRLMTVPPDHFLIIEPEAGIAEIMKAEIEEATGRVPVSCSIPSFLQDPSQAIGAVLLAPAPLLTRVQSVPPKYRTAVVPLSYSSTDQYVAMVTQLKQPSVIGLVSVSMAGLTTVTGTLAPALGARHTLSAYLMEFKRGRNGQVRKSLARFSLKDYRKPTPVLLQSAQSGPGSAKNVEAPLHSPQEELPSLFPAASISDLRTADLLFCDSSLTAPSSIPTVCAIACCPRRPFVASRLPPSP